MKKQLLIGVVPVLLMIMLLTGCTSNEIILTKENQELAENIYNSRALWQWNDTGVACRYCFFQEVDGKLYFEAAFDNSASEKYRVNGTTIVEDDYFAGLGRGAHSFIMGVRTPSMPDYNCYASDEEKLIYVENLVKELQDPQRWKELTEDR